MNTTDISCRFLNQLQLAASQYADFGDLQSLADLIGQVQKESFYEGYIHAIEILQNSIKGEKNYEQHNHKSDHAQ